MPDRTEANTDEAKSQALLLLSLYWLRPSSEEDWAELTTRDVADELCEYLAAGFDITISPDELFELFPSFADARSEHVHKMSTNYGVQSAAPVESIYKIWSNDPTCKLPNARETGYVMGDPAYHMMSLLKRFEISLPEDFTEMPDHLSVILNLAGILADSGNEEAYRTFVCDHLDWIGSYKKKLETLTENSFFLYLLNIIIAITDVEMQGCTA